MADVSKKVTGDNTDAATEPRVISFVSSTTTASTSDTHAKPAPRKRRKPKINPNLKCALCESGVKHVTYKDIYQLKKFTSAGGKIIESRRSGTCAKHQRQLARAIKRARQVALMPYVASNE